MKVDNKQFCLYAITDRQWLGDKTLEQQVEQAILGGATFVQYREKQLIGKELLEQGRRVREVCRKYQIPFIVNDDVEMAIALDADGVHVGQKDMQVQEARKKLGWDKVIGVSSHNVREALEAQEQGADYLGAGAVFSTSTKSDAGALSHDTLREICQAVSLPVVAIGGIGYDNVSKLAGTGISGVAVIHAVFGQENIRRETRKLREKVERMLG